MKITLNIPMIQRSWDTNDVDSLIEWYYDQDDRLNDGKLPCFGHVSSITIEGEGHGRVRSEVSGCLSPPNERPMITDRPPPLPSPDAPGVHVTTALDTV